MKNQHYKNHLRLYPPHHFILLPLLGIAIGVSFHHMLHFPFQQIFYLWMIIVLLFIFYLAVMLRQHYALGNQDRIVRLEMRLRYYQLTNQRFDDLEKLLSFKQIAALRFAPDDELLPLIERAVSENLSPNDIKQSIKNWQPDDMRV